MDVQSSGEGYTTVDSLRQMSSWSTALCRNYQITYRVVGGIVGGSLSLSRTVSSSPVISRQTPVAGITGDRGCDLKAGIETARHGGNINLMNIDIQPGGEGGTDHGPGWEGPAGTGRYFC